MVIIVLDPQFDDENDVESPNFVQQLKDQDATSWTTLEAIYGTQVSQLIYSQLVTTNLTQTFITNNRSVEVLAIRVWSRSRRKVDSFTFTKRGSLFKWICDIAKDCWGEYFQFETAAFTQLLKEDDRIAWHLVVENYERRLLQDGFARLDRLGFRRDTHERAKDLLQDSWITIRRKIQGFEFKKPGSLYKWFIKIQENKIRNHWRTYNTGKYVAFDSDEDWDPLDLQRQTQTSLRPVEDAVVESGFREDYERSVFRIMDKLKSPLDQQAVLLYFLRGLKPEAIEERLGHIKRSRIYELVRRVKMQIREDLLDYLDNNNRRRRNQD